MQVTYATFYEGDLRHYTACVADLRCRSPRFGVTYVTL